MPMHPTAPEDLAGRIDAYAQTSQAVIDLTAGLSEDDLGQPSVLPGWSVRDIVAHLAALEARLLGRPDPQMEVAEAEHIRNSVGAAMEQGVQLRRGRTGAEIVREYQRLVSERVGRLRAPDVTEDDLVPAMRGEAPLRDVLTMKTCDTWCHEQDIRETLGRPGDHDTPAAATWTALALESLPDVVVSRAAIEPGKVVMIELTGPITARAGVRVERPEKDGEAPLGRAMFSGDSDETGPIPAIGSTTSIQLATQPFLRRAAGRVAVADMHYTVHGDEDIARRVLEAFVLTP